MVPSLWNYRFLLHHRDLYIQPFIWDSDSSNCGVWSLMFPEALRQSIRKMSVVPFSLFSLKNLIFFRWKILYVLAQVLRVPPRKIVLKFIYHNTRIDRQKKNWKNFLLYNLNRRLYMNPTLCLNSNSCTEPL